MKEHKFKVGQKVIYLPIKQSVTIKKLSDSNPIECSYWIEFDNEWWGESHVNESDLVAEEDLPKPANRCECGAHKTRDHQHHSHWCPEYRRF